MPVLPVPRRYALLAVALLLTLLAVAGRTLAGAGASVSAAPVEAVRTRAPASAAGGGAAVVVHVVGAVRAPGLFELADGARVADAVRRAGGATARADLAGINLAAPVADGIQILVPQRAPEGAKASGPGGAGADATPAKVSLSSATLAELDALPGVGPVTAQKILDHRQAHGGFRSVDDLDAIAGIGSARIEHLRELVTP